MSSLVPWKNQSSSKSMLLLLWCLQEMQRKKCPKADCLFVRLKTDCLFVFCIYAERLVVAVDGFGRGAWLHLEAATPMLP